MKCEKCGLELDETEVNRYQGKVLCEDCCFDLMDSRRVCDPMAVSSTLSVRKQLGQSGTDGLTELQKQIYSIVAEKGKIGREEIETLLKISPEQLDQEYLILRHCELLRGFKENGIMYITKF